MRDAVQACECRQIVRRGVIDEATILRAHEQMVRQVKVGTATVNESGAGLRVGACEVRRGEHHGGRAGQDEGRNVVQRHAEDIRPGYLV